ncbi:LuxR C-terminal-related transcriptional regulator [Kitasatospora sp. NPDC004240]
MTDRGDRLPDGAARELYVRIVEGGGRITLAEAAGTDGPALARLVALGLLVTRPGHEGFTAVNPRAVADRISSELRSEATRLLVRAQELPELLGDLVGAYQSAPPESDRSCQVRQVAGPAEIARRVEEVEADCRHEILAALPGAPGPRFLEHVRRLGAEGGVVRVVLPAAAELPAEFAERATALGARLRVLHEPFRRLRLYDRRTAVIDVAADEPTAAFVEDRATVGFLVARFERDWARADDLHHNAPHTQVGRLLAQGLTQRAIAARLGLSERTVAGHISRLRELYDAATLFQLGWQMRGHREGR